MIPQSSIDEWRAVTPWSTDLQVEQDLVVSRAVAEFFAAENMRELMELSSSEPTRSEVSLPYG